MTPSILSCHHHSSTILHSYHGNRTQLLCGSRHSICGTALLAARRQERRNGVCHGIPYWSIFFHLICISLLFLKPSFCFNFVLYIPTFILSYKTPQHTCSGLQSRSLSPCNRPSITAKPSTSTGSQSISMPLSWS